MIAPAPCEHEDFKKSGKNRNGSQRYKCKSCGHRFSDEAPERPLGTMRIGMDKAAIVLNMLVEGMSIRSCERMTGIHRDTICDLILVAGEKCQAFHDAAVRDIKVNDVQMDEIWSFVGCKGKTAKARGYDEKPGGQLDVHGNRT